MGKKAQNFFLQKGKVQIVLPNKKTVSISLKEFKRYLLLLFIYKEFEILRFVIKENRVNQRVGLFNTTYFFFLDEYLNNNNINVANNEKNTDNTNKNKNKINNVNNKEKNNISNKTSERKSFKEIKEIQRKNLSILMKFYLTEEEISFYERTKDTINKEVDDNIKLSTEHYINRLEKYSNFNFYKEEKNNKNIIELQAGDMFGDLALSANNAKRTATIITVDECHFACLTRELYCEFIEKGNERIRNNKINYLCGLNLLKSYPRFILERKLFNHFAFKTFQKDKYVLKTGEINNNIIFLKDGIFEMSFTGKLNDINELINFYYNQYIHIIKKKEVEEKEEELVNNIKIINMQKSKIERLFQKDINEEFSYILFLVNAPSIFGFRPTEKKISEIVINNKENTTETVNIYYSNFCVKCYSSKGEYVYIDKNIFYKHIYNTDGLVQDETKNCLIEFFRKTLKRLLNIRYIKIWNLFLANGVDKNLNLNINWDKLENNEDIYTAVDKLLSVLNEGQIYSNEMSKYINDYFEKKKLVTQTQKHKIKLFNQNYESDKIKKMLILRNNKNLKNFRNLDYFKNNQIILKNINLSNMYMEIINSINNKKENNNLEEKYKKLVKKILNMTQENLKNNNFLNNKGKTRNKSRFSSVFQNKSLFVSRSGKNITINNYLYKLNREKPLPKENFSFINTAHSPKNGTFNDLKKVLEFSKSYKSNKNISKKEEIKYGEMPKTNIIYNKIKNLHIIANRPSTTKSFLRHQYFDSVQKSKEKYVNDRVKYIIKNTRILFTKNKNLEKIVRMKRSNSTL